MLLTDIQSTETRWWNVGMPMTGTVRIEQAACGDIYMETSATLSATPQSIQLLSMELGVVSVLHWFPCQYPYM